jgi:hypothetical protein
MAAAFRTAVAFSIELVVEVSGRVAATALVRITNSGLTHAKPVLLTIPTGNSFSIT